MDRHYIDTVLLKDEGYTELDIAERASLRSAALIWNLHFYMCFVEVVGILRFQVF